MQIDWFTLVAEIVNFLILVILLKKLLYERILSIAEEREQQIASRYEEAESLRHEAEQEAVSYEEQRRDIEERRDSLLQEAREEVREKRHEMICEARSDVESQQEEWYTTLAREQERFLQELQQYAGEQVYTVARRALSDLANADLEQQVVAVFIERLRGLSEEDVQAFLNMLPEQEAEVRSTFPLSETSRDGIRQTLRTELDVDITPHFVVDEALVCGVTLRVDGRRVAWNIDNYLNRLESDTRAKLEETFERQIAELEQISQQENGAVQAEEEESTLEERIEEKVRALLAEQTDEADRGQDDQGGHQGS